MASKQIVVVRIAGRTMRRGPGQTVRYLAFAAHKAVTNPNSQVPYSQRVGTDTTWMELAVAHAQALAAEHRCLICSRILSDERATELIGKDCEARSKPSWYQPLVEALTAAAGPSTEVGTG